MQQYDILPIYITEFGRKYLTNNYGQLLHRAFAVADLSNVK